jgi:hypothetical protein
MSRGLATGIRRAVGPTLFLGCAFLLTAMLERSFVIQSDEGYTLNAAWQLWNGLRMYDDFRLFVGPGSGYAIFAVWKLIGSPSYLAARWLSLGLSFSSTTALYLLLRRLGLWGVSLATAVVLWLCVASLYVLLNHNTFSSFAAIWFLLAFVRAVRLEEGDERDRTRDHVVLGATAGLVFLFLPIKGSLLAFAAAAFLLAIGPPKRRFRPVLALGAGFVAVVAPLFLIWRPATLVRQWLIIPITGNYLGHTGASGGYLLAAIVMVAAMAVIAFWLGDRALKALTVVQAALFVGMSHNMEASHFAINSFPAVVFAFFLVHERLVRPRGGVEVSPLPVIAMFAGLFLVWTFATVPGARYAEVSVLRADLLGGRPKVVVKPRIAEARAIYAGPFLPGLYYLLGKKNPFFVSETVVCDDDCQRRLVAQLSQVKPELAFLDYDMIAHLNYPRTGPVDVYLRDHYAACPSHGGIPVRAIAPAWCP